jgi:predicted enzyme related to lactoylglutathione lyase
VSFFHGINVVSISVPDLDVARVFYRDVLGLGDPRYDLPEIGWIEFGSGAPHGNLAVTPAEPGWQPSHATTVVLNTPDCQATRAGLVARGVRCDEPQLVPGYVVFCSFYDPFGNRLQMVSPAPET